MRRPLAVLIAAVVAAGTSAVAVTPTAAAEDVIRPRRGMFDCPEPATGLRTVPSTEVEAEYNDDLTVCDWGPFFDSIYHKTARYSFRNASPVVWAFYDTVYTSRIPRQPPTHIYVDDNDIAPLFREFALDKHIINNGWIVSPEETVWFSSLEYVGFTPAYARITAAWLVYNYAANKLRDVSTAYVKRMATAGSKTRTFLWNCTYAAISAKKSLALNSDRDPTDVAKSWLGSAAKASGCIDSYKALFPKRTAKLPPSTYMRKWFNATTLTEADEIVEKIGKSAALTATVKGIFRIVQEVR